MGIRPHDKREKDLFDQIQTADKKIRKKTRLLLPRLKDSITISYENVIFIVIAIIMSCIISFSLGVEKGRQDIGHRTEVSYDRKGASYPKQTHTESIASAKKRRKATGYIIQLAAFVKITSAKEEAERLKREGYDANIKKSGTYYQLYIGGFERREAAERAIKKLKERYADCYIRKIGG